MWKKLFLFLILAGLYVSLHSQACQPDPAVTKKGVTPDSATNFVDAYVGMPYSQLVTIIVPKDTNVIPGFPPFKFDSIVLASFTGLPASLTYACGGTGRCVWPGDSKGCLIISGTPSISDTGTHKLSFTVNAYVGGSKDPIPNTISYYRIKIHAAQSVRETSISQPELHQNYPNPFSGKTKISFLMPAPADVEFVVFDMLGRTRYNLPLKARKGLNELEFDSKYMAPGLYFYSIRDKSSLLVRRAMVVEFTR